MPLRRYAWMAVVLLLCSTITAAAEATKKIKIGIVYD
jgi:hypothetical protein